MTKRILGCIADDFTGATDLANNLVRSGMRVVQTIGVPEKPLDQAADAVVVALKSRTVPADEAIKASLEAARWLSDQGAEQIYFKYCSTFDSTAQGNIGPVTDALMRELGAPFTIATPAFPDNQRTVFKGHLFVGDALLSDSGMRNHPLTPMTDANLVRVLQSQTTRQVGLIDYKVIGQGVQAIRKKMAALRADGIEIAIVDAISNEDLVRMGPALCELPLLTAGSGVAIGLAPNFGIQPSSTAADLPAASGLQAILAGSCSQATNEQVSKFIAAGGHATPIDPLRLAEGSDVVGETMAWAERHLEAGPVLIYSTGTPDAVKQVQARLGVDAAGELVERALAELACRLVKRGVGQLVVAGGETSGACVKALDIRQMLIGDQIDPGVPWCYAATPFSAQGIHITLKSGNFGAPDFFNKALGQLSHA